MINNSTNWEGLSPERAKAPNWESIPPDTTRSETITLTGAVRVAVMQVDVPGIRATARVLSR